ncbi:sigma factor [Erwinia phage vB_EamM-Bue1]|uniref:Sigma factor involved in late transcription n=2 Tax=Nezavisimistyvirus TaxID=2841279 RepID=A0A0A0YR64_9CAUD|nr:sigma factor involved in late transcription [Erwinia phage phiEa2809]YP_009837684.1 sigma factor [Erwinia phage vB_EamM-Bue1]AIX13082.1 sigma factor involved in late transcription [Erwinia phage phiEa2809]AVO22925.1 sigma factor [Erwinia phage vB_EamM-Bue1]
MGMNFVERADTSAKYFSDKDNDLIVDILVDWIPGRKAAIANGTKLPAVPEIVGRAIQSITERTSTRYNYRDYPFREDMVGDAVLNMIRYLHTFDVSRVGIKNKVNFFSWVTMCADRSFSKKISDEEGQTYLKLRAFEEVGGFAAFQDEADVDISTFTENTGIAMDFRERLGNFEDKRERQRTKEREKAKAQTKTVKQAKIPKAFALYLSSGNNSQTANSTDAPSGVAVGVDNDPI